MNIAQPTTSLAPSRNVYAQRRRNLVLAAVALASGLWIALSQGEAPATEMITVTVAQGESLWSLAEQFAPENQDPREWIYDVTTINQLQSSALTPGMALTVPVLQSK